MARRGTAHLQVNADQGAATAPNVKVSDESEALEISAKNSKNIDFILSVLNKVPVPLPFCETLSKKRNEVVKRHEECIVKSDPVECKTIYEEAVMMLEFIGDDGLPLCPAPHVDLAS